MTYAMGRLVFASFLAATCAACTSAAPARGLTYEPRIVTVEVRGSDEATFSGRVGLGVRLPDAGAPLNMLVVSTDGYIDVGPERSMSIGIALVDLFEGDGTYDLEPHTGRDGAAADLEHSSFSRVTFFFRDGSRDPVTLRPYDSLAERCTVVIADSTRTGDIDCPSIVDQSGKHRVGFSMTWRDA